VGAAKGPDDLDEAERARIRRRVLAVVPPRPGIGDRAYGLLALLAAPAPHLVRAIVSFALVAGVVASATVASADALPDEPLYAMKIASEQLRLALAVSPEDRAAVELSMAQHRLAEAERLALSGSAPDVVVVGNREDAQRRAIEAGADLLILSNGTHPADGVLGREDDVRRGHGPDRVPPRHDISQVSIHQSHSRISSILRDDS